ncbi:Acetophenone carboxylase gamma subunit [Thalassovita gelatinovora]|uniref:Acetophenone carboxylase gamma subunit n=1 Tax=Thalassovita gelatinovora TaxID=53501 RepID=A0A0P1F6N6_THAGE|nr:hydantoinase/oxoprolinase family protein [Thalassovita gelatinovora]QIZ79156.1 hydantoinase/oxoprolinase family protein [Thalassovita gelatinovora]CUH63607.1 Acetophenone carboxylase gamma subunit [Thalassovita gelatinovora]SER00444.1 N-methylhydantoinase A [Thalassovita gelatinovora]
MTGHLSIDFGARFADFVAWDEERLSVAKIPNGPNVADVFRKGLAELAIDTALLGDIRMVTTTPLNALLDRRVAKVALLTTEGFGDTLRLGRQNRVALYDPVAKSPAPSFLVSPEDIHEISGRLDAQGTELSSLSEDDLDRAISALKDGGIEAVAICFLFSHMNPIHERRAAEAIRAALPNISISLSHIVDPAPREYDRTVSALVDAWIAATSENDLRRLEAALPDDFTGQFLLGEGRGVLVPAKVFDTRRMVLLTGGPAAAARAGARRSNARTTLAVDIGSQSADIALIQAGDPVTADFTRFAGVELRAPVVDMASVSLGGARRARRDETGIRFDATDTTAPCLDDALAVLGLLPDPSSEGLRRISAFGSSETGQDVSREIVRAAAKVMALELTRYATRRNVDPTRADLLVMGGTGPLLATEIAEQMGLEAVIIPRAPAVSGAIGLAQAPQRYEASRRIDRGLDNLSDDLLVQTCEALDAEISGNSAPVFTLTLAALEQMHPIQLTLTECPATVADLRRKLICVYVERFGISPPGTGHLFEIKIHRDEIVALPPSPFVEDGLRNELGLLETEAGMIYLPASWTMDRSSDAYYLKRVEL